jgi:hypothetical protein
MDGYFTLPDGLRTGMNLRVLQQREDALLKRGRPIQQI